MIEKKVGRPKKRPEYDHDRTMQELLDRAVELLEEPYDDRDLRDPAAPSITSVAQGLNTTLIRARKLLITADYYSTELSRKVQSLYKEGRTIAQIAKQLNISEASVYSYLPYSKGIYNLDERSLNAERGRIFKKRKLACEQLEEHLDEPDVMAYMWSALIAFQDYPFATALGYPFKYQVADWKMSFNCTDKTLDRATIELAFRLTRNEQKNVGYVSSHKKIGTIGSSYLYPIFLRLGVCNRKPENTEETLASSEKSIAQLGKNEENSNSAQGAGHAKNADGFFEKD